MNIRKKIAMAMIAIMSIVGFNFVTASPASAAINVDGYTCPTRYSYYSGSYVANGTQCIKTIGCHNESRSGRRYQVCTKDRAPYNAYTGRINTIYAGSFRTTTDIGRDYLYYVGNIWGW